MGPGSQPASHAAGIAMVMVMARQPMRGMEGSATCICTEANTARAMKSGSLDVFATPSMVALMEQAACNALRATAEEEGKVQGLSSSSVGTAMSVEHLAATSLGRTVVARATITAVGPKQRSVTFDVVASDSTGSVIGRGTHQRVIVGTERFMAKASSRQEQAVGGVEIRPFQPSDLPQVHALFAAGMRHYHAAIPADRPQRDKFIEQWNAYIDHSIASDLGPEMGATYLDSPRSGFWCAVDRRPDAPVPGAIIGIVGADEHCEREEEVELRRMSVASSARGLGLGKRLVARVEQHARECGFQAVMLSTGGMMDLALQLYRSCGYTEAEPHSWSSGDGEGVVFRKQLRARASL